MDVRDCAAAHIRSWERRAEVADARCLLIAACPSWREICDELRACGGPQSKVATALAEPGAAVDPALAVVPPVVAFETAVAQKLGQTFRDWRATIRETYSSLVENGHLEASAAAATE